MKKLPFILLAFLFYQIPAPPDAFAVTPDITGPEIKIINNDIIVMTSISDVSDIEKTIKSGVGKELIFTAELMRVYDFWPDEFVVSKKIRKVIKYDNLREQYTASTRDGINRVDRKFTDYNKMKDWIFSVNSINLANIKELEPGSYYIRLVVESRSREKLPLIGFVMYLLPEIEMSLAKESEPFSIGINK
ncbi:MAG: DUF4390 domain-containing protein [Nitrospirae bacterium]|nr:DUF4390 domain-containing protein [Nitrospirota bacterium]